MLATDVSHRLSAGTPADVSHTLAADVSHSLHCSNRQSANSVVRRHADATEASLGQIHTAATARKRNGSAPNSSFNTTQNQCHNSIDPSFSFSATAGQSLNAASFGLNNAPNRCHNSVSLNFSFGATSRQCFDAAPSFKPSRGKANRTTWAWPAEEMRNRRALRTNFSFNNTPNRCNADYTISFGSNNAQNRCHNSTGLNFSLSAVLRFSTSRCVPNRLNSTSFSPSGTARPRPAQEMSANRSRHRPGPTGTNFFGQTGFDFSFGFNCKPFGRHGGNRNNAVAQRSNSFNFGFCRNIGFGFNTGHNWGASFERTRRSNFTDRPGRSFPEPSNSQHFQGNHPKARDPHLH